MASPRQADSEGGGSVLLSPQPALYSSSSYATHLSECWAPDWQKAISIFDMVEVTVTCPALTRLLWSHHQQPRTAHEEVARAIEPYVHFVRRIGVHAGITLYNLHRVLCYACEYDLALCEQVLHVWTIPNSESLYANGEHFRREAKRSNDKLFTDKTITLSSFLPTNAAPYCWTGVGAGLGAGFTFEYTLAGVTFCVTVTDLLKGHTAQQDLLWVPRLCEGSFGLPPPLSIIEQSLFVSPEDSSLTSQVSDRCLTPTLPSQVYRLCKYNCPDLEPASADALTTCSAGGASADAAAALLVDLDSVNRILSETRFGRNLAVSRKSKRTRITAFREESSRLVQYRLPIRLFFTSSGGSVPDNDSPHKKRKLKSLC